MRFVTYFIYTCISLINSSSSFYILCVDHAWVRLTLSHYVHIIVLVIALVWTPNCPSTSSSLFISCNHFIPFLMCFTFLMHHWIVIFAHYACCSLFWLLVSCIAHNFHLGIVNCFQQTSLFSLLLATFVLLVLLFTEKRLCSHTIRWLFACLLLLSHCCLSASIRLLLLLPLVIACLFDNLLCCCSYYASLRVSTILHQLECNLWIVHSPPFFLTARFACQLSCLDSLQPSIHLQVAKTSTSKLKKCPYKKTQHVAHSQRTRSVRDLTDANGEQDQACRIIQDSNLYFLHTSSTTHALHASLSLFPASVQLERPSQEGLWDTPLLKFPSAKMLRPASLPDSLSTPAWTHWFST